MPRPENTTQTSSSQNQQLPPVTPKRLLDYCFELAWAMTGNRQRSLELTLEVLCALDGSPPFSLNDLESIDQALSHLLGASKEQRAQKEVAIFFHTPYKTQVPLEALLFLYPTLIKTWFDPTCVRLRRLLVEELESRRIPPKVSSKELEAHALGCPCCQEELTRLRRELAEIEGSLTRGNLRLEEARLLQGPLKKELGWVF